MVNAMDDQELIKIIRGVNQLGEALLDRLVKLETEMRGIKAKQIAVEQIVTRQVSNQTNGRSHDNKRRRVSKKSLATERSDHAGEGEHSQKA
jgi:hypothetical protein